MKKLFLIMILLYYSTLLSQVEFEYFSSFNKINPDYEYINIWFDDLNEDGENEIYAAYRYENSQTNTFLSGFASYNMEGEVLSQIEFEHSNNVKLYCANTFQFNCSSYLIAVYSEKFNNSNYMTTVIYNLNTFDVITNHSLYIGIASDPWNWDYTILDNVHFVKPIFVEDSYKIFVGITISSYTDGSDSSYFSKVPKMKIFSFVNHNLQLLENINNCGTVILNYPGINTIISVGKYYSSYNMGYGQCGGSTNRYYLNRLSLSNLSDIMNFVTIQGNSSWSYDSNEMYSNYPSNFRILSTNDDNFEENGLMFFYKIMSSSTGTQIFFQNYSSDLSGTAWIKHDSFITNELITASTCIPVNGENHYVMYFRYNQLEIRDRTDGQIIHHQYSPINPFSVQRNTDGELIFITNNMTLTGYNLYALASDIVVSTNIDVLPDNVMKLSNYPNPFNPSTTIQFELAEAGEVSLEIFNIKGQKVRTLTNEFLPIGKHERIWNGKDNNEQPVASGIYFYKLRSSKYTAYRKMILLK
jgi:hypothetical protein